MNSVGTIIAAGATDAGLQREVNEDRFFVDEARGIFIVVDGIGGQAAGGKAADVAMSMLRQRLDRETGPACERVREAIAIANNEIFKRAEDSIDLRGMTCVVTLAIVSEDRLTIGHVGDSRLYKLTAQGIEKLTRDHSPVGEREDAREISEAEAMRSLQKHSRPLICTEWLKRDLGSVAEQLPVFLRHRVGCLHWGLVNGKTQTQYPWGSKPGAPEPKVWQHDLFRKDRTPYDPHEIELFKQAIAQIVSRNRMNNDHTTDPHCVEDFNEELVQRGNASSARFNSRTLILRSPRNPN